MSSIPLRSFSISLAALLVACGGSSKSRAPDAPAASGDDPATPFDDAAVKAAIADTPWSSAPACGDPESIDATLGALFRARAAGLTPGDETFECKPHLSEEGAWQCTWSVFTRPTAPADPCMEGEGSGFQIIVDVSATGALEQETFVCVAPG
jgi:hypothetical protein